ncbi:MAG: hypothetical protein EBV08_10215, partial [Synechococcaceae bacterium WB6_1B_055]|nr:hypothetical protein [Synechococcaceae bacterium WB6_1B_055]
MVLSFVYGVLLKVQNPKQYFLYIAVGLTVWQFISTIISTSPTLLRDQKEKLLNQRLFLTKKRLKRKKRKKEKRKLEVLLI